MPEQIAWQDQLTDVGTTQLYTLGRKRVDAVTGLEYRYVKASVALAQYDYAITDTTAGNLKPSTGVNQPWAGSPQVAIALNSYGWVCTGGFGFKVNMKANVAANTSVNSSATGGYGAASAAADTVYSRLITVAAVGGADGNVACMA